MAHHRSTEQNRPVPSTAARRRLVGGLGACAGMFVAFGLTTSATAPSAHADFEDAIVQPIIDAIAQAINVLDPSLASSLDPGLALGSLAEPAAAIAAAENATIPLQVFNTDPVVELSVGGGPNIPVVADTGSEGLMVPWYDVGLQNLLNLGSHLTLETASYGGSPADPNIEVLYIEDPNTTVDFGNGIVTSPTTVDLALFAYPAPNNLFNLGDWSLPTYLASDHADGFLGIGNGEAELVGPGPSSVITALPGDLNQGVLINEPGGYLEFGPNPLPAYASVEGAPLTFLEVSVNGGPVTVAASIDSGGQGGTIPSSILIGGPSVGQPEPPGTEISVSTTDGQLLYSFTTGTIDSPRISSDTTMNTGWWAFRFEPVYLSYSPAGIGTTTFDY
jgi:hypothetical protein